MIRGIIIEDERHSRETLLGMLDRYCKNVSIVAEADTYRSGLEVIREHHPDVVFLDIQMPDGSGFRLLEELEKLTSRSSSPQHSTNLRSRPLNIVRLTISLSPLTRKSW